jgi:hypothetical protein
MAKQSAAKRHKLQGAHPDGTQRYYEPHESDPPALTRACPACHVPVGTWCAGIGDIHDERLTKAELQRVQRDRETLRARRDAEEARQQA